MLNSLLRFAHRQDAEEIGRQHAALMRFHLQLYVLNLLVYGIPLAFLPWWIPLTLALVDTAAEHASLRLSDRLDPARNPGRYLGVLLAVVVTEAAYMTQVALLWQLADPYAKALATALATLALLQATSMRAIHLPNALTAVSVIAVAALIALACEWRQSPDLTRLAAELVGVGGTLWFVIMTLTSNHTLHDEMARDGQAAMAADRAKSRFLAQMSHELRTPLNAILGLGHAEMTAERDPGRRERLELVVSSARGLAVILDDILDLSAIEEGRMPLRPRVTDPAAEIRSAAALYRPFFAAAGLELAVSIAPEVPPAAALDAQRLRQCLANLLSNALKHTRSGGVQIAAAMPAPHLMAIEVSDTGPGVPAEEAERIFEPFRQGSSSTSGSGLGLSISRALARAMGGDLRLMPASDGARFRLTLAVTPQEIAPRRNPEPAPGGARYPGARVLVVDDIATNRLVARAHLTLYGLRCEEAGDGETALARIAADPPDLVLLDLSMPGIDGHETLRRLRAMPPPASRIRVVAMTADATAQTASRQEVLGFDGYLIKPLTPEAVGQILTDHFGQVRRPRLLP